MTEEQGRRIIALLEWACLWLFLIAVSTCHVAH